MAERSTALILRDRLTEQGLARALGQQDVNPAFVRSLTIEEAALALQRSMYPVATAKKAKAKYVAKAKKSTKVPKARKSATRAKRPNYWKRVKQELHLLICTDDPKYASLRKHLGKESKPTQIAIVTSIAGTIGAYIGVAAAVIGPFVTLGLMALLQVGHNAWCAAQT